MCSAGAPSSVAKSFKAVSWPLSFRKAAFASSSSINIIAIASSWQLLAEAETPEAGAAEWQALSLLPLHDGRQGIESLQALPAARLAKSSFLLHGEHTPFLSETSTPHPPRQATSTNAMVPRNSEAIDRM